MTKKHYLSRIQEFRIGQLLEVNGTVDRDMFTYAEGWSDARVAQEAIPEFQGNGTNTVGGYRVQVFGKLTTPANMGKVNHGVEQKLRVLCKHLNVDYETL